MGTPGPSVPHDAVRIHVRRSSVRAVRRATLAGVLAAAAIAVAAFLTLGSRGTQIGGPLAQAATYSSATAGYRVRMSAELTSPDLPSPVTFHGHGVVDVRDQAMSMTMALGAGYDPQMVQALGSSTLHMTVLVNRTAEYMRFPRRLSSTMFHARRPWIKLDLAGLANLSGGSSLADNATTSDPRQVLQSLRAASAEILNEGRHRIGGVSTTEYFADLDLSRLADRLPVAQRKAARAWAAAMRKGLTGGTIPTRVWIDGRRLVRRINMIEAENLGGTSVVETLTLDFSHYGVQKPPKPPRAGQVTDMEGLPAASAGPA